MARHEGPPRGERRVAVERVIGLRLVVALTQLGIAGCGDTDKQVVPLPTVGPVHTPDGVCTGTVVAADEVLTAASCIGSASADDLSFSLFDQDVSRRVDRVVRGREANGTGPADWALLTLGRDVNFVESNARFAAAGYPMNFDGATTVWWAASSRDGKGKRQGLCALWDEDEIETSSIPQWRHDCDLGGVAPGTLLFIVEGDAPRAVGMSTLSTPNAAFGVELFAEVPNASQDVFTTNTTLGVADMLLVFALDEAPHITQRLGQLDSWTQWKQYDSDAPASLLRLDAATERVDLPFGVQLETFWGVDELGALWARGVDEQRWHRVEGPDVLVDVAIATHEVSYEGVYVLTRSGAVCVSTAGIESTERDWRCSERTGEGRGLTVARGANGTLVFVVAGSKLYSMSDDGVEWSEGAEFGEAGLSYRAATAGRVQGDLLYVVAASEDTLRLRISDLEGKGWSSWRPLNAGRYPTVERLARGRSYAGLEELFAIADGELFHTVEVADEGFASAVAELEPAAVRFEEWHRFYDIRLH